MTGNNDSSSSISYPHVGRPMSAVCVCVCASSYFHPLSERAKRRNYLPGGGKDGFRVRS